MTHASDVLRSRRRLRDELVEWDYGDLRWVGLPVQAGRSLRLSTGTISALGSKREIHLIDVWNSGWHLGS